MNMLGQNDTTRVAWVLPKMSAGGIGPVCRYAAEELARRSGWQCILVALHDPISDHFDTVSGVRFSGLGLDADCPLRFIQWLVENPQDIVITNDVSRIEAAFPYFPEQTAHVVQLHDSLHRYRAVAVRNAMWIDGVTCVARHIENRVRPALEASGFRGPVGTCHNGAAFPPSPERARHDGPMRLLFTGKMDSLIKGVIDLEPILCRLVKMNVPVRLTIVGGRHESLARRLARRKLDHLVTWTGRVPHDECYRIAANNDVFLMLSRREPFGMVTIEAMSMGCVPIAYDTPSGSTEIIEHGVSGLLVPLGDFEGLARTIQGLHENRAHLHTLASGAADRARSAFDAVSLGTHTAAFLGAVMSRRQECRPERLPGLPAARDRSTKAGPGLSYQSLPGCVRNWLREAIGSRPRLAYWASQYWNQ